MGTKQKVALVIGQLGFGGGEGQLFELARGLRQDSGFEPTVFCLSSRTRPYGPLLRQAGVSLREISTPVEPLKALILARYLRSEEIKLVHSFLYIANRYCFLATRLMRNCILVTSARNCKRDPGILGLLNRASFRTSRAIVCNSNAVAQYVQRQYGAPRDKIQVIYNGVDASRFCPRQAPHNSNGRPLVVGTAGRIEAQKNPALFLKAAARLRQRMGNCRFVVAGSGSQMEAAKDLASKLGIGSAVEFLGARSDVNKVLRGLDVFWLTSDWEGTPNVVLEAMASGVPVVATAVGACAEILENGETGFLVDRGDLEALVERTELLLGNRKKARKIAENALREVTRRFSLGAMISQVCGLYQGLLDNGN